MDKAEARIRIRAIKQALKELEELMELREFHCYHCETDKPMKEHSRETSAMCQDCADATNPRLHPELLKDQHPHLYEKYMAELPEYRKEHEAYVRGS